MKKILLISIIPALFFLFTFVISNSAFAQQSYCPYGGGPCIQQGNLAANKTVQDPVTKAFLNNLTITSNRFGPGQIVTFKITITNTGNVQMGTVDIKDLFPQFLTFVSGPGTFNSSTNTLSFQTTNLNPNESRDFIITGKILDQNHLPSDPGVICLTNQVIAASDSSNAQDTSQFCIEKQITQQSVGAAANIPPTSPTPQPATPTPATTKGGISIFPPQQITTTPPTGPELIPLAAMLPTGLLGLFLKKKSKEI